MIDDEEIYFLEDDEIIVFGSNTEGRHGKGFALTCKHRFGAKYGQAKGLQGKCYAIVTKDLKKGLRSIPLQYIFEQLIELCTFATDHPSKKIILTKIGINNAGYSEQEISDLFNRVKNEHGWPKNIQVPHFNIKRSPKDDWLDFFV